MAYEYTPWSKSSQLVAIPVIQLYCIYYLSPNCRIADGGTQANTASVTAGYILIDGKYYYANTAAGRAEAQGNGVATTNKVAGTNIAENGGLKAGSLHEVSAQGTLSSSQGNNVVVLTTKQPNV